MSNPDPKPNNVDSPKVKPSATPEAEATRRGIATQPSIDNVRDEPIDSSTSYPAQSSKKQKKKKSKSKKS